MSRKQELEPDQSSLARRLVDDLKIVRSIDGEKGAIPLIKRYLTEKKLAADTIIGSSREKPIAADLIGQLEQAQADGFETMDDDQMAAYLKECGFPHVTLNALKNIFKLIKEARRQATRRAARRDRRTRPPRRVLRVSRTR